MFLILVYGWILQRVSIQNSNVISPFCFRDINLCFVYYIIKYRRTGSDGSMSASGSAGPGFDPRQCSKFSFENFQSQG